MVVIDRFNPSSSVPHVGEDVLLDTKQRNGAIELLSNNNDKLMLHSDEFKKLRLFSKEKPTLKDLSDNEVYQKLCQLKLSPDDSIREKAWNLIREIHPARIKQEINLFPDGSLKHPPESGLATFHARYGSTINAKSSLQDLTAARDDLQGKNRGIFAKIAEWFRERNSDYSKAKQKKLDEISEYIETAKKKAHEEASLNQAVAQLRGMGLPESDSDLLKDKKYDAVRPLVKKLQDNDPLTKDEVTKLLTSVTNPDELGGVVSMRYKSFVEKTLERLGVQLKKAPENPTPS